MAFGQVDLQSNQWLSGHTGDRPVIDAIIAGFVTAPRCYQVFIMKKGLLYLDLGPEKKAGGQLSPGAAVAAGVLGGAVGGLIAGMVAQSMAGPEERGPRYDMQDDDTLLEMARGSKHSFVSLYNEIDSVSIDAPGFLSELFGNGRLDHGPRPRERPGVHGNSRRLGGGGRRRIAAAPARRPREGERRARSPHAALSQPALTR
jgi:hypothetical protein